MRIGAGDLLKKYGSRMGVAEALIMGKIFPHEEPFIDELVNIVILQAAKIRLEAKGELEKLKGK